MIATAVRERQRAGGLRLLDARKDLRQVADLIEEVFAGEIGPAGLAAVRDLRMMASLGPLVWLMERASGEFRDAFTGFVWVEGGRVVGNATLSRVKPNSDRWHISNVAVQPAYRGRGIGRQLVEAIIELARNRGGAWALLQVRDDNEHALHIYDGLGFTRLYSTTEMERNGPADQVSRPALLEGYRLAPCRPGDWRRTYDLALATTSAHERWVQSLEMAEYRRSPLRRLGESLERFLTGGRAWRECLEHGDELAGALSLRWRDANEESHLAFCVKPEHRGLAERLLVEHALSLLGWRTSQPIHVEHPAGHAEGIAALKAAGFVERRTLVTMRREL